MIIRVISRLLYKILGAEKSSMLATSSLGDFIAKLLSGDLDKIKEFKAKYGLKLLLTPKEASLLGLSYFGEINPMETKLIRSKLKGGDIFIDIGTYVDGWHSLVAAKKVGPKGHVYSFEPHPVYYRRFVDNVKINNLKNITAEKMAVSHKNGSLSFFEGDNVSSLYKKHVENYGKHGANKPLRVKAIRLDNYIKNNKINNIALIKIDVECAEMDVLKGSSNLLKQKMAPDLLVEVIDHFLKLSGSSEKELLKYLASLRYQAFEINSKGLNPYKKINPHRETTNLYFSKIHNS